MRRALLAWIVALAVLGGIVSAETVDEVVAKNLAARGGLEAIRALRSVRLTGTVKMVRGRESRSCWSGSARVGCAPR